MLKSFRYKPLLIIVFVSVFTLMGLVSLDPDFGWRVRSGELILNEGIQKTDPFSYTMPNFPWVDHAWLISYGFYFFYSEIGKLGLSAIMSVFAFLCMFLTVSKKGIFYIITKRNTSRLKSKLLVDNYWYLSNITIFLSFAVILPYFGVRAQVMTWLMFAIFLRILFDEVIWSKWKFFVPIYFLVWTNLHGGYVSGLAVFLFVILGQSIRNKKLKLTDLLVLIISFVSSFINPYGEGVWREVWSTISDTSLRWTIIEWMPSILTFNPANIIMATLSFTFILKYRKKFNLEELGIYLFFFVQGILSRRNVPLWLIVAIPMTIASLGFFYQDVLKISGGIQRLKTVYKVALLGSVGLMLLQVFMVTESSINLSEKKYYPWESVGFLKNNLPPGRIFSTYNWGGYLIWKLPEKKVYVDGRMPSWRWESPPAGESGSAFVDYRDIVSGEIDYKLEFENYGVDTVLWPSPRDPSLYELLQERLDNFLTKFGKEKNDFDFIEQLRNDGWKIIYKDDIATVYSAPL